MRQFLGGLALWTAISAAPTLASEVTPDSIPPSPVHSETEAAATVEDKIAWLAAGIDALVETGQPVGAEVLIVQNGEIIFHNSFGWSDRDAGRRMENGSIFSVASMTKPIIGTAILMLADDRLLSLGDPVARFLPSFGNPRSRDVTIEHLLTHRSGFGYWGPLKNFQEVRAQPNLRTIVDMAGEAGPSNPIGDRFAYSNMSSMILTAIIEEISGQPAEMFLRQRIFAPLGMNDTHTTFSPSDPWAGRVTPIYCWDNAAERFEACWTPDTHARVPFFRGSGGVRSTTSDYLHFVMLWMNKGLKGGQRLLSEAIVEQALKAQAGRPYGYHWGLADADSNAAFPATFGHPGADGTLVAAYPAANAAVLIFTQSAQYAPTFPPERILELVAQSRLIAHAGPYRTSGIRPAGIDDLQKSASDLTALVGEYRSEGRDEERTGLTITIAGNRLHATLTDEYGKIDETLVRVAEGVFSPGWFVGEHVTEYNPLISYHFSKAEDRVTEVRFVVADEPEVVLKPVIAANHP
ncbi:MAG: serine hydrolase domain-containing protein [Erythrobacter sp.]